MATHQMVKKDNVSFMRLVDDVTETVIPQGDFALAVGASERTVQNWSSGQTKPRGDTVKRVLDLVYLVRELREVYTDEGVHLAQLAHQVDQVQDALDRVSSRLGLAAGPVLDGPLRCAHCQGEVTLGYHCLGDVVDQPHE